MDLKKALLTVHSKPQTIKIATYIGDDPQRFKELLELFVKGGYQMAQRAAWPLGICADRHPELVQPYFCKMIENLKKPVHDAVKRSTIRIFQNTEIPEKYTGRIAEICFEYLSTPSETIAVRVYSMSVLLNITKKQPDLKNELKIILEDQLPYASAAFLSRAKKVLKELDKLR